MLRGSLIARDVFLVLDLHAWRRCDALELSPLERFDTRASLWQHVLLVGIGGLSFGLAVLGNRWTPAAGWIYGLIGPALGTYWSLVARRRERVPLEKTDMRDTAPPPLAPVAEPPA